MKTIHTVMLQRGIVLQCSITRCPINKSSAAARVRCPVGDKYRRIHVRTVFLTVAMILNLSATAAIAEPVAVRQQTQIASTHTDVASSSEPRDRSAPTATDEEHRRTASYTQATRAADSDPEPESISGGTEP
jgi:hypothetical protein